MITENIHKSNVAQDYGLSEIVYSFAYNLRLKHASFQQSTLSWIAHNYSQLLPVDSPNILGLGCGNGVFDNELLKIIQQHKKEWSFTGLDFSKTDLDYFREHLFSLDENTRSKMTLKYQKFDQSTDLGARFDLITMVHFLNSFDDVLPIIQNALQHLLPGGKLLIIQQKSQGIPELQDKFADILPNHKFQCTNHIKDLLRQQNIAFTHHKIDTYFDVSIMQKMSLDTLILMSFCFINDLSVLNAQQQDQIRQAFLSHARKQEDGKWVIYEPMEAIICQL